ncbi:hypothetical protein RHS01_04861 [Rhizoctonia solani]|uniref:FAS1 domain-containing protein n=1 Tax=Rhizoctonia solani TaxID=456999 RepID=A0A8H7M5T0_9AGAM|nr:hypothetical protein RHS01_04861 [Rhizoctonia solani]
MRWRTLANALLVGSVLADQQHFEGTGDDTFVEEYTFRKTIIDVLSADEDYTLLLKALQRARLVPTLNRINGSTLFAPTNAAIERYAKSHPDSLWASLVSGCPCNIHTPNASFSTAPDDGSGPPSHEPPDLPPWMPVPGGLLAGEPQRVRITWRDDAAWVAVSEQGEGGLKIVKGDAEASNGRVIGVDGVIPLPKNLDTLRYLTPSIERVLSNSPHLTLFVPDDKAWDVLQPMEKLWLDNGFAERDLMDIFARHATTGEKPHEDVDFADNIKVGWSEYWGSDSSYQSLANSKLQLATHSNGTTMVNNGTASVLQKDVYASNGVLHTLDSLLVPSGAPLFKATAEKWLLALNATVFVGMLREAGLDSYVNGSGKDKEWTILAPADDVLNDILRKRDLNLFGSIKDELKTLLRYHVIPGILEPKDLVDGQLVGTELRPDSLKGERMRLKVDVVSSKKGDIGTEGEGVRVDNTIIYLLSRPLNLPPDAIQAALGSLDHTTFTSLLFSAGLNISRPATTLLVPVNGAFAAEGVVFGQDLSFDGGAGKIATLADGDKGNGKKKSWGTVEGSDVRVVKEGDSLLIEASGPDESPLPLTILDTLTRTGALHEVSGVLWPRSVRVGIRELGLAADASTMLRLVQRAGFEGIWNGTGLPVDNIVNIYPPQLRALNGGNGGFVAMATAKSPSPRNGHTRYFVQLTPLLRPERGIENLLNGEYAQSPSRAHPTTTAIVNYAVWNTSDVPFCLWDVIFAHTGDHGWAITVKGADEWAGVKAWGKTVGVTPDSASRLAGNSLLTGGVVQIDRVLEPYFPSWWREWIPALGVGAAGVATIGLVFWGVIWVWKRDVQEATYEPANGDEDE